MEIPSVQEAEGLKGDDQEAGYKEWYGLRPMEVSSEEKGKPSEKERV